MKKSLIALALVAATSRDDPRVYRTDVVSFRSPAAQWLAEIDPETVLALLDELGRARHHLAAVLDSDIRDVPQAVDALLAAREYLTAPSVAAADATAAPVDVVADLGDYVEPAEVAR